MAKQKKYKWKEMAKKNIYIYREREKIQYQGINYMPKQ